MRNVRQVIGGLGNIMFFTSGNIMRYNQDMAKMLDLTGMRFGRWTVLGYAHRKDTEKYHYQYWHCLCDCGTKRIVEGASLRRGNSVSCNCIKKETAPKGSDHYEWKKSGLGYHGVHAWLRRHFGNASICEGMDCRQNSSEYNWALIKGKRHERKRENYMQLCRSCHALYDGVGVNLPR